MQTKSWDSFEFEAFESKVSICYDTQVVSLLSPKFWVVLL